MVTFLKKTIVICYGDRELSSYCMVNPYIMKIGSIILFSLLVIQSAFAADYEAAYAAYKDNDMVSQGGGTGLYPFPAESCLALLQGSGHGTGSQ